MTLGRRACHSSPESARQSAAGVEMTTQGAGGYVRQYTNKPLKLWQKMFVFQMYLRSLGLVHHICLLQNKNTCWSYKQGRKAFSSSGKPLECLYTWEQLIQSKAIILQKDWKQVVPVTSSRCALSVSLQNQPPLQGCITALPSQTDPNLWVQMAVSSTMWIWKTEEEKVSPVKGFLLALGYFTLLIAPFPNPFTVQLFKWD